MLTHTDTDTDISVPGIGIGMNTRYRSNPRWEGTRLSDCTLCTVLLFFLNLTGYITCMTTNRSLRFNKCCCLTLFSLSVHVWFEKLHNLLKKHIHPLFGIHSYLKRIYACHIALSLYSIVN